MSWLVVFTTVIFPLQLVLLLAMDLVELGSKQLESPSRRVRTEPTIREAIRTENTPCLQ